MNRTQVYWLLLLANVLSVVLSEYFYPMIFKHKWTQLCEQVVNVAGTV